VAIMEIIGLVLTLLIFAITMVVGGVCFIKSIYFFSKALSHRNVEVTAKNYFTSFNFTNALLVPKGLTSVGKMYRLKALKNIGVFMCLMSLLIVTDHLTKLGI
jgi:hypothetical protein